MCKPKKLHSDSRLLSFHCQSLFEFDGMIFYHPLCACGWDDVYHPLERVVVIHFVLDRNPDPLDLLGSALFWTHTLRR